MEQYVCSHQIRSRSISIVCHHIVGLASRFTKRKRQQCHHSRRDLSTVHALSESMGISFSVPTTSQYSRALCLSSAGQCATYQAIEVGPKKLFVFYANNWHADPLENVNLVYWKHIWYRWASDIEEELCRSLLPSSRSHKPEWSSTSHSIEKLGRKDVTLKKDHSITETCQRYTVPQILKRTQHKVQKAALPQNGH